MHHYYQANYQRLMRDENEAPAKQQQQEAAPAVEPFVGFIVGPYGREQPSVSASCPELHHQNVP